MTDLERARAYYAADEWPDPWPVQREQAIAALVQQFAAVRADERTAVYADITRSVRLPRSPRWEEQLTWD